MKNVEDIFPLSPMQQLMLVRSLTEKKTAALTNLFRYSVTGDMNEKQMEQAWQSLINRHGSLRTCFVWENLEQPVQVVRQKSTLRLESIDLSSQTEKQQLLILKETQKLEEQRQFDLRKAPLFSLIFFRLSNNKHQLWLTRHHLIMDGWSHNQLFNELSKLYLEPENNLEAGTTSTSFKPYVDWLSVQKKQDTEKFWTAELAEFQYPSLVSSRTVIRDTADFYQSNEKVLDDILSKNIVNLALRFGVSEAVIFQAALCISLANLCRLRDVAYGLTVAGRPPDLMNVENTIGSFINNIPMRIKLDAHMPVESFFLYINGKQRACSKFEHVSPIDIQQYSQLPAGIPVYDLLLLWGSATQASFQIADLVFEQLAENVETTAPLLLAINKQNNKYKITTALDQTKVDSNQINEFIDNLVDILFSFCAQPQAMLGAFFTTPVLAKQGVMHRVPQKDLPENPSTLEILTSIWKETLGLQHIGLDDDFFELGGSSLQASVLLSQIEKQLDKVLPLSTLLHAGSIRAFLKVMQEPLQTLSPLVTLQPFGQNPPLYVVPGVGGNVVGLKSLSMAMGNTQPLIGFQSIGLDGKDDPLHSIEEIAAHNLACFPRTNLPFVLFGVCWGASVAYEMAQQLRVAGREVPLLIMMDPTSHEDESKTIKPKRLTISKSSFIVKRLKLYTNEMRQLNGKKLLIWLKVKSLVMLKALKNRELIDVDSTEFNRIRVTETNLRAALNYSARPYSGNTLVLLTDGRNITKTKDKRQQWLNLLSQYKVHHVAGSDTGNALSAKNVQLLANLFIELSSQLAQPMDTPRER